MSSVIDSAVKAVRTGLAENFGGVAQNAAPPGTKFSLEDVPDQSGKVALVTGGSQGIGYGITHALLSKNISKVFILSMSKEVVDGAVEAVKADMGEEKANRTKWIQCDLTDWERVAEVSKEIRDSTDRLDIIVNNAARGVMTYQLTDYNVDRHMALNHMGHVVLNSHLLPLLKKTADDGNTVRIVTLGSNAHQASPSDTKFDSLEDLNQDLGANGQYGRSKLAVMLYARYLSRHLTKSHPKILANTVHPGFVSTKQSKELIHEAFPLGGYAMSVGMEPFKKDQFEGALSSLYAATATENSGEYICPPAIPESGTELAQSAELGEQLMKLTREIVTEKTKKNSVDKGCPMKFY